MNQKVTLGTNPNRVDYACIGKNVSDLREKQGLTVAGLAEISGLGKKHVANIETGAESPTIEEVWRLASALDVNFGALLSEQSQSAVLSKQGISALLMNCQSTPRTIETFLLDLPAGTKREAEAHQAGVRECVVLVSGRMLVGSVSDPIHLVPGQSATFSADVPHIYTSDTEACRALVTVIYPSPADEKTPIDLDLPWPKVPEDWDNLQDVVRRSCIEVQNGCALNRITFSECEIDTVEAVHILKSNINSWFKEQNTIQFAFSGNLFPSVAVLFRTPAMSALPQSAIDHDNDLFRSCVFLAGVAQYPQGSWDDLIETKLNDVILNSESLIETTLAAEALTRRGCPTVPFAVGSKKDYLSATTADTRTERLFEDRIDVDAYEAYELVHPAYARQVLALAAVLPQSIPDTELHVLDVGTGPGVSLQMLLELRQDIKAWAVDPSETAFHYLTARFKNEPRVTPIMAPISEYQLDRQPFMAAISIGASHHLDTALFFRSIHRNLSSGGILVVSDEMMGPFKSNSERSNALMIHHLQYVFDTLFEIPTEACDEDRELVKILNNEVPYILMLARAGLTTPALRAVRALFQTVSSIEVPSSPSHRLATFSRFHLLELQALIAGLDYEVEQKTYPIRFQRLAESSGFVCQGHHRVYATAGDGDFDAGTHLFVFRKST